MAKNANNTGTFRKLPSGNWQVQAMDGYREDGKKKYVYFTAPTKSEARQMLAAYQSKKNAPEETASPEPPQAVLLGDLADTWYADYATQVRASTYATYGYTFIWSSSRDSLLYSVGTFRRRFYKALEAIPGVRKLSPHCCRHTYSTLLQAKGVSMRNTIFGYCKRMENKPMAQFTKREVNKFVSAENVTNTEKNILYHFWNYCLERYYCEGSNPFERPAPKTLSPESQVNKNKIRLSMSLADREYIFRRLRANPNAYACLVTA